MIEILMAAYNGETYIAEQIESILKQTEQDWHLTVQDDCSTDRTAEIVKGYWAAFPEKITYHKNERNLGGAKYNFYEMILSADADYIMTCDQDDVWLPNKLEKTLAAMKDLELQYGSENPLLVHSDLTVVNSSLQVISGSMFLSQELDSSRNTFSELLVQNQVTGCTMMINRALLKMFPGRQPGNMIMHDWWAALIAAAFGAIGFVNEPTILYRQHNENEVGAKNTKKLGYNLKRALKMAAARKVLIDTYLQAGDFARVYQDQLTGSQREIVCAYAEMGGYSKLKKWKTLRTYQLWKSGFKRRLGQMLFC